MGAITTSAVREIIDDFADEIKKRRLKTAKPSKTVINFRTDKKDGIERIIWRIPISILRYRKDNGRIASDIADYEYSVGSIDEKNAEGQARIATFLDKKDREKTEVLSKSIMHDGQEQPAIITCDGFLINGNRRKLVMDRLHKEHPENDDFAFMKAVILPGKDEEGGPPTKLEIEMIENRYQLQSDGKSEYYNFDRALSIKRKIEIGLSLEDQLRDDPGVNTTELDKAVKKYEREYLEPLACIDRYLKQFKRIGLYRMISAGTYDPEGRWQAFLDYSKMLSGQLMNPKRRTQWDIEEDEIGNIEEAAFDIIRLRSVPDMPKVHEIMRNLPKYCSTKEGKRDIMQIADVVEPILPPDETVDEHGKQLSFPEIDAKWVAKNKQNITYRLKKARTSHESRKEKETPLELLEAAYDKLSPDVIHIGDIAVPDLAKARRLVTDIQERAHEIEGEIFHFEKECRKLGQKKS